ncbi:MAG: hypothetical protein A3F75_01780 [Betaproteobacteria bacterium RIFCSPLOWO2_12_FULL_64_23]|nr:MAG: hypothetical protein A3F75_01780 [Betaproteobacteria bacterium RIFCSPLOWO2_12_FULL_64_23]
MNTLVNKFPHLPLLVGGIAAILVSGIAIASLAISGQGFQGVPVPGEALDAAAAPAIAAPDTRVRRCAECGVIESMREIKAPQEKTGIDASGGIAAGSRGVIGATPLRIYEITIRLRDGSMRVIQDAKPATWRRGEPVTVIAGVN